MTKTTTDSAGLPGLVIAGVTAIVSGVSVFVNSYGVHAIAPPAAYTTAKNIVAAAILLAAMAAGRSLSRRGSAAGRHFVETPSEPVGLSPPGRRFGPAQWFGLAYVGVVGGGLAFLLFFNGLASTAAEPAAFWRATLVLWVAVLALPILRERVRWWNIAAILLLVGGQVAVAGGLGHLAADSGELLILASSLLWALEVVVAKALLRGIAPATLSATRMGIGAGTLFVWLAAHGELSDLRLDAHQLGWALLTGALLALYVGTWFSALSRARALDVSSILPASVLVTFILESATGTSSTALGGLGIALVGLGAGTVLWMHFRNPQVRHAL